MKRLFAFALTLIMLAVMSVSTISVSAADYGCDVDMYSSNVYVENLNTGTVVLAKNIDEQVPPASLTKIMTYIVVTENVPDLENTYVTVTSSSLENLDPASSVMGLSGFVGSEFSVLELLYGLMLPSGNDAALVLANFVGDGSVDNFVEMMNRKAGQLGCKSTHFVNPHGLYDSMHYSTASELAVITKYAMDKPHFKEISNTTDYYVAGMGNTIETTNYLIDASRPEYYYQYAKGIKTGYTDEAGKCLISTAAKDNYEYLCIALGSPYSFQENVNYAMLDSKAIYQWMFDNVAFAPMLSVNDVIDRLAVEFVWGNEFIDVVPEKDVAALLPKTYDESLVTTKIELPEYVSAPVDKGEVIGTIAVSYNGELVGTTNLVSNQTYERDKSNYFVHSCIGFVVNNIIWLTIVFAIVVLIIVVKINSYRQKKKRQARRRYR